MGPERRALHEPAVVERRSAQGVDVVLHCVLEYEYLELCCQSGPGVEAAEGHGGGGGG